MTEHISHQNFISLLDYYITCIEKEDMLSLTFNFKSDGNKFYSNIFQKEELFHCRKDQVILKKSTELENFLRNYKFTQKDTPLFYGYPLVMDTAGKISPIFFIELLYEEKNDSIVFTKLSVNPEFNHYILAQNGFQFEEINKIQNDFQEEDDFLSKLEEILNLIDLNKENISPSLQSNKLELQSDLQLINKVILYVGERTGITYGLLQELQSLKKKSIDEIKSGSLAYFLDVDDTNTVNGTVDKNLLEVFPINTSQEESVISALTKPLTVVTGPPGTGKSQVVLNIIANAVYHDKTILFASKNNKAVDVVIDKLNSLLSKKLIVRMGHRLHRRNTETEIKSLLLYKSSIKIETDPEHEISVLKDINMKINTINKELDRMAELNNTIDQLQNKIDSMASQLPVDLYILCKQDSFQKIDKFKLETDLDKLFNKKQGFIQKILEILFPARYRKKCHDVFHFYYGTLSSSFRRYLDKNIDLSTNNIEKTLRWLLTFKQIEIWGEELAVTKKELSKISSSYDLKKRLVELHEKRCEISRPLFENYWLQKIQKTNIEDQNHVSRYFDATEKLEAWIESQTLWKELLASQIDELQKICQFLPVWVVTNLSAKNSIPLKSTLFDILIIDEASQCDIASALPLMFRAKQVIIIGDPKQLKHISLLKETQDKSIASEKHVENLFLDFSYTKNSLYDLAERTIKTKNEQPILLNEHYRSHPDIITFSNEYFYDRKLNILTDQNKLIHDQSLKKRILWVNVKGRTVDSKSPYNLEEADVVVDQIISLFENFRKSNLKKVSFGIVTLFKAQMDLIIDKISKIDRLKDIDITVGTAHRFQGDEKDIILFSPAVSDGVRQSTLQWIHSTNQLLNVAITRAKSALIIVGDQQKCAELGGLLSELVKYAEKQKRLEIHFDSPVEKILYDELIKNGVIVVPQYCIKIKDRKSYRLDFALFINDRKYDIEIDGDKAHSQADEYDILRDIHLRTEGWKIRRFHASEIQNNLNDVVEHIKRFC